MVTAFLEGRIFVGNGMMIENGSVLVENDRIVKVADEEISLPDDARRIPLDGNTLMPGFIDCHVHLCLDASLDPIGASAQESDHLLTLKGADFARKTLMAGITSVRDMGGKNGVDLSLRDAIETGIVPGPRVLASGLMICMTGGHGWQMGREADGPDEVRKAVREQLKRGVDLIKLMATGGILTPGVEPASAQLTENELRAGIEEAHKAGRKTATHAQGNQGIRNAVRAGIDSVEHGFYMDEEIVELMKEKGTAFIPTLSIYTAGQRAVETGIPQSLVDEYIGKAKGSHLRSVRMAREAGVLVAMGTDAGTPFNFHGGNLSELLHLVEMGYSRDEALQAGTGIAARVLGREDLGSVEEGKLADLIIVQGDPLTDIDLTNEKRIQTVMKGGQIFKDMR